MDILLSRGFWHKIYTWLCPCELTFALYQHEDCISHIPCLVRVYIYIQI